MKAMLIHHGSAGEAACRGAGAALPAKGPVGALDEAQHLYEHIGGAGVEHRAVWARHHISAQPWQRCRSRDPAQEKPSLDSCKLLRKGNPSSIK